MALGDFDGFLVLERTQPDDADVVETLDVVFLFDIEPIIIKRKSVVLNRYVSGDAARAFESEAIENGFDIALRVPDDVELCAGMGKGESVFQLSESSPALQSVGLFLDSIVSELI